MALPEKPVSQPSQSAEFSSGMKPATNANVEKKKRLALWLGIAGIAIFIIGILYGFAVGAGAILGAYALLIGLQSKPKSKSLIIIGSLGLISNFTLFTILTILSIGAK